MDAASCAFLPSDCALCASPLPRLSSAPICDVCWTEFPALAGTACACCGDALDAPVSHSAFCRACRLAPPAFQKAVAYGAYQDRLRAAIHALKYDRLVPAARDLGNMLAQAIATLAQEAPADMLAIPIPLHRAKHAERGFNQARLLTNYALESLCKTHPAWKLTLAATTLMRLRVTQSQASLTPRQRRLNVRGAFSVSDPGAVAGRHVLLIDDILTTGATARAAALALKRAGADTVWVATLARARRLHARSRSFSNFNQAEDEQTRNDQAGQPPAQEPASMHAIGNQPSF